MGRFQLTDGSEKGFQNLVDQFMEHIFNREAIEKLVRDAVEDVQNRCKKLDDIEDTLEGDTFEEMVLGGEESQLKEVCRIIHKELDWSLNPD